MIRIKLSIFLICILSATLAQSQQGASYPEILNSHPFYGKQVTLPRDTALNGSVVNLEDYKNHIVLIHFWSLTCSGCYKEIPELNILAHEFMDRKVLIISYMEESSIQLKDKITSGTGFYKLKKPVYGNDLIEFEIIPNAGNVRSVFTSAEIPRSGVPITFLLKNGILKDLSYGYMLQMGNAKPSESANYQHLKAMIEKYRQ
ncbi:MAG TPA: redoxin domain-containing protein [Chryseolinea sp.]|nr:redoxin domain-containing protein [Chryseolinea sp.]